MRTSIRGRLVFSYVLMTVLSVAVMGGLGLSLVSELGQLREQRQLGLSALAIADQAEPWLDGQAAPVVLGELAQGAAFLLDARVRILGSEATVLADAMAVDQGAQIAWLAAAPADPAADPAADPSEPRPGEAPAEPTFARRLEDVHELIFASGALTQAEQGRPAGGLTFALRRGEPSFGPGGMQLELLTQAAPPGQVVTRGLELARVVHALDASDRVPELEPVRIELGPMALRVDAAGGHHALLDDGIGRHLATFLAGDLGQPEPPRSPRVVRVAIGPNEAPTGFVEISQAPDVTGANLGATARAFGLAALGASLLSALVGLAMSRGLSAPLAELDAVAARMGAGDLA
ncbi:MAG: hypothetical protein KDH92_14965, partial [Chloroflexi bacterium]|nr:hypothetical protein [Chloroflexota bacterium]